MNSSVIIICAIVVCVIIAFIYMMYKRNEKFTDISIHNKLLDNTDQLILYYSDYCGHCHKFMPIWDEYANKKIIPTVKICADEKLKIQETDDEKTNRLMLVRNIQGYPTIVLRRKNGTEYTISGEQTLAGLSAFVSEHMS